MLSLVHHLLVLEKVVTTLSCFFLFVSSFIISLCFFIIFDGGGFGSVSVGDKKKQYSYLMTYQKKHVHDYNLTQEIQKKNNPMSIS